MVVNGMGALADNVASMGLSLSATSVGVEATLDGVSSHSDRALSTVVATGAIAMACKVVVAVPASSANGAGVLSSTADNDAIGLSASRRSAAACCGS